MTLTSNFILKTTNYFVRLQPDLILHYDADIISHCSNIVSKLELEKGVNFELYHYNTIIYGIKTEKELVLSPKITSIHNNYYLQSY